MQLSVKTVSGEEFRVEVEPTSTVAAVKETIHAQRSDFPIAQQKLIYAGKVLKDDQVVKDCGIVDKKFLVLMITKPKAPKPAASQPAPSTTSAPNTNSGTTTASQSPATASDSTPTSTTSASTTTQNTRPPQTAAPPQAPAVRQEDVDNLVAMGFVESECRAALEAAMRVGGDQNVAVEFLMNGIPPNLPMGPPPTGAPSAPGTQGQGGQPGPVSSLAMLRNHPQFAQIRQLVQSNPSALETVLQHIGQQNPQLLQLIRANQAEFLQMLNEPISNTPPQQPPPQQMPAMGGMPQGAGGMPSPAQLAQVFSQMSEEERDRFAQSSGIPRQAMNQMIQAFQNNPEALGAMPGGGGPQPHVIHLTAEEAEAVTRLQELGFSQQEAAEAFLACDRNHEAAANFLLSGLADDSGFMVAPDPTPQTTAQTTTGSQDQPPTTNSAETGNSNDATGDSKEDDEDMYS